MTLYARHKLLLALVHGADPTLSATDFEKIVSLTAPNNRVESF